MLLLFGGAGFAQPAAEPQPNAQAAVSPLAGMIRPLVDDQTILIAHFDLEKFDFDRMLQSILFFVEESIKGNQWDAAVLTQLRGRLQQNFNYTFRDFRKMRERLIRDAGVKDLFVVYYKETAPSSTFVIASPSREKTPEQREAFSRIMRTVFPIVFEDRGMMICTRSNSLSQQEKTEQKIRAKTKDLVPREAPFLDTAFGEHGGAAATFFGFPNEGKSDYLNAIPPGFQLPPLMRTLFEKSATLGQCVSLGVSFQDPGIDVVIQTASAQDASTVLAEIRKAFEQVLNNIVNNPSLSAVASQQASETVRNLSKQFFPTLRGSELFLRLDSSKVSAMEEIVNPFIVVLPNAMQPGWGHQCSNNLKTLAEAVLKYRDAKGAYPPAWTADASGTPLQSWRVLILPYLDEEELYSQIRLQEPWNSEHNRQFHSRMPMVFRCPASIAATDSTTTYAMIVGPGAFPEGPTALKPEEITDSLSSSILLAERRLPVGWMKPEELTLDNVLKGINTNRGIGSNHPTRGANVVFFDGSVRFINETITENVLKAAATSHGGELFELPPLDERAEEPSE